MGATSQPRQVANQLALHSRPSPQKTRQGLSQARAAERELCCRLNAVTFSVSRYKSQWNDRLESPGRGLRSELQGRVPLYRLEKQYRRLGIPISRSTMTDLFHRHAELLAPLPARILERVRSSDLVLGDETSIKMLGSSKRAYVWTFIADTLVAYRFSTDRSGDTPKEVLGGTQGTLVVDGYTGYNHVTKIDGRRRAGCLAHARRKLFAAMDGEPEAREALDMIRDVYVVEHAARGRGIVGTPEHRALRQAESLSIMHKLKSWLEARQGLHPPKSKFGVALRYALRQWDELTVFLDDPTVPLDNNRSEAALRVVALGRKNFLFVGNEDAGDNIAGLYSLVATCEANGVNPIDYLRDVLIKISTHPADRIDELLPDRWKPAESA